MAVYTEVSDEELAQFIGAYGLGELLSYKGIAEGVENTNYLVHTTKGTFILTIYEKRVDPDDLPFFLGLMEHLSARGVTCPLPVRDAKGNILNVLAGRHAALITFLEGMWPRRPKVAHCLELGKALARMHVAGQDFPIRRVNALGLQGWRPLFDEFAARAEDIMPGLRDLISTELKFLESSWPDRLPQGVIHADLFPDNVFFIGENLSGLIDFYFACNDALAYDIAICLNAWCFEPNFDFNATKGRALLMGYDSVRRLSSEERDAMPILARGAAMRFLLTRSFDWLNTPKDALVARKDPFDYVRRLRFHKSVASIGGYGCEWHDEHTVAENSDLQRRRLLRQSGTRRLGRDPDIRRPPQRDQRRRRADDQQSHGATCCYLGARSLEEAQRGRTVGPTAPTCGTASRPGYTVGKRMAGGRPTRSP